MAEKKIYSIVVNQQRVEVSEDVYRAYHKAREAERYQKKQAYKYERSLERFQEEGVNIEYHSTLTLQSVEDTVLHEAQISRLQAAIHSLSIDKQILLRALFFYQMSESELAKLLGVSQSTISRRRSSVLRELKNRMEF